MRYLIALPLLLAACTDDGPVGGPIDPLFARAFDATWNVGGLCRVPAPFGDPDTGPPSTLEISDDGVLRWEPTGIRHVGWMATVGMRDAVRVDGQMEGEWFRDSYAVTTVDGATFGTSLRWSADGVDSLCNVTLTPR